MKNIIQCNNLFIVRKDHGNKYRACMQKSDITKLRIDTLPTVIYSEKQILQNHNTDGGILMVAGCLGFVRRHDRGSNRIPGDRPSVMFLHDLSIRPIDPPPY